jgi:uncharacterized small protein (DUF1192 family)
MKRGLKQFGLTSAAALLVAGCATTTDSRVAELEQENERLKAELDSSTMKSDSAMSVSSDPADLYPPNANPGECYARVLVPPQYKTETRQVTVSEETELVETSPAEYQMVEERILVKEEEERLQVIPAVFEWREEQVLVKPEHKELVTVPAKYETVTEQVQVKPARTEWKKGRGPIERIDDATGEIMCLVEVPAEFDTITKRVEVSPATTREVVTPAEYTTVRKQVIVEPAKTTTGVVPAEYKTVSVRQRVKEPEERRVTVPAEFATVTEQVVVSESELEWRPILCETNATPELIAQVQSALTREGFYTGPIDGQLGAGTMSAASAYQRSKGIASGQLTMETLYQLEVMPRPTGA